MAAAAAACRASTPTMARSSGSTRGQGDRSRSWRWPGTVALDRLSRRGPWRASPTSPLIARVTVDASYLRAMFGSLALLLPIAGVALGALATTRRQRPRRAPGPRLHGGHPGARGVRRPRRVPGRPGLPGRGRPLRRHRQRRRRPIPAGVHGAVLRRASHRRGGPASPASAVALPRGAVGPPRRRHHRLAHRRLGRAEDGPVAAGLGRAEPPDRRPRRPDRAVRPRRAHAADAARDRSVELVPAATERRPARGTGQGPPAPAPRGHGRSDRGLPLRGRRLHRAVLAALRRRSPLRAPFSWPSWSSTTSRSHRGCSGAGPEGSSRSS